MLSQLTNIINAKVSLFVTSLSFMYSINPALGYGIINWEYVPIISKYIHPNYRKDIG